MARHLHPAAVWLAATTDKGKDVLTLLKQDHDKVRDIFQQFEKSKFDDKKFQLAQQACMELTIHAQIEEQAFYPEVRKVKGMEDMVMESLEEHRQVKELIARIQPMRAGEEHLDPDVKVLKEDVEHHAKEEEQDMFGALRKEWKLDMRKQMGQSIEQLKMRLMSEMGQPQERRVREEVRETERARR